MIFFKEGGSVDTFVSFFFLDNVFFHKFWLWKKKKKKKKKKAWVHDFVSTGYIRIQLTSL